jgi:hypothetical protein
MTYTYQHPYIIALSHNTTNKQLLVALLLGINTHETYSSCGNPVTLGGCHHVQGSPVCDTPVPR